MNSIYRFLFWEAAMALYADSSVYANTRTDTDIPCSRNLTDEEKRRIHDNYKRQFHKFTINGTEIIAKSKKDAKKIYSRRMKGGNK